MKRLMICALAAVLLAGCGKREANTARPEHTELEITVEGVSEQLPAALYIGDGYSIYIPEEGWEHEQETEGHITEDSWESTVNDEVELRVLHYGVYPDASLIETKSHFARECGYVFTDLLGGDLGDPLTGIDEDGDWLGFMAAEGQGGETYVVAWEYPAGTEEGFGARLPQIANTFEVTK